MDLLLKHSEGTTRHTVKARPGRKQRIDPYAKRPRYFEANKKQWWKGGTAPERDSFRQRVYRAERRFADRIEQRGFANITEVARYVRNFIEKPWFQRRFPLFRSCEVIYHPGSRTCYGGPRDYAVTPGREDVQSGSITMSSWGMGLRGKRGGELVVLHELAHAVLPYEHLHDRRFVRVFLEFVGCALGQDYKRLLREEFKTERIPYSPVKTINFSQEHLQRLAAARPVKQR